MTQPYPSWFALRRELFAVALDPWTLHEVKRGFLPAGTLIDTPQTVLRSADACRLEQVIVRLRANEEATRVDVARVGVEALRIALGALIIVARCVPLSLHGKATSRWSAGRGSSGGQGRD